MAALAPRERLGPPEADRVQPFSCTRLYHIEPVNGWWLCVFDEWDGDRFCTPAYVARHSEAAQVWLDVSRFRFSPTQERFAWLVRNGFPPRPALGPWDDLDIDARIAGERSAA